MQAFSLVPALAQWLAPNLVATRTGYCYASADREAIATRNQDPVGIVQ